MTVLDSLRAMLARLKSTADHADQVAEEKDYKALQAFSAWQGADRNAKAAREHAVEMRRAHDALRSEVESVKPDEDEI